MRYKAVVICADKDVTDQKNMNWKRNQKKKGSEDGGIAETVS